MQFFYFDCASCGTHCQRAAPAARYCGGRCRMRALRARQARAREYARLQTAALLRGDAEGALRLARRAASDQ